METCYSSWLSTGQRSGCRCDACSVAQRLQDSTAISARAIRERRVVNVADLLALSDDEYAPIMKRACELAGFRSGLSVPLLRDQQVIGAITVNRAQTGLLRRQGSIAAADLRATRRWWPIENVRLFNETQGSAGAADRDRRGAAGDQRLGGRCCSRCSTRSSKAASACLRPSNSAYFSSRTMARCTRARGAAPRLARSHARFQSRSRRR